MLLVIGKFRKFPQNVKGNIFLKRDMFGKMTLLNLDGKLYFGNENVEFETVIARGRFPKLYALIYPLKRYPQGIPLKNCLTHLISQTSKTQVQETRDLPKKS